MKVSAEEPRARRRAILVAMRTLRRRPHIVGETEAGEVIAEFEGVRVALPRGGSHFHRLSPCSRCKREALRGPVLTTAQLAAPAMPFYCSACATLDVISPIEPAGNEILSHGTPSPAAGATDKPESFGAA